MRDGLSRRRANIDPDVVATRMALPLALRANGRQEMPHGNLLIHAQVEEVGLVASWEDEGVSRAHRIRIRDRHSEVVLGDIRTGFDLLT
jgi:hypothetical protein